MVGRFRVVQDKLDGIITACSSIAVMVNDDKLPPAAALPMLCVHVAELSRIVKGLHDQLQRIDLNMPE